MPHEVSPVNRVRVLRAGAEAGGAASPKKPGGGGMGERELWSQRAVCGRAEHLEAAGLGSRELALFIDAVCAMIVPVESHFIWRPQLRDASDEVVLEAAVNGRADASGREARLHEDCWLLCREMRACRHGRVQATAGPQWRTAAEGRRRTLAPR